MHAALARASAQERRNRLNDEPNGSELFGPGHTWWEVYEYAVRFMSKRWPGASTEMVEDAVAEAVERTMHQWVHWKGSVVPDNPKLTLAGAKRHACMWAHRVLKRERKRQQLDDIYVPSTSRQTTAASEVLDALQADEREWDLWAKDWLEEGLSEREAAHKHGVSQPAIHYRRKAGMARINPLLTQHYLTRRSA